MAGDIHQRIQECFRLLLLVFCLTSFPPESGASRLCIIEARARTMRGAFVRAAKDRLLPGPLTGLSSGSNQRYTELPYRPVPPSTPINVGPA